MLVDASCAWKFRSAPSVEMNGGKLACARDPRANETSGGLKVALPK